MKATVLYLQQTLKSIIGLILGGLLYISFYYANGLFVKASVLFGLYLLTKIVMYKPKTNGNTNVNETKSTPAKVIKMVK